MRRRPLISPSKNWDAVHPDARGSFLFGGEFSKTPTMISALLLPNFCLSPQKCPRFIQFSRFSYAKPQVMGLLESLDSFDRNRRFVDIALTRRFASVLPNFT